MAHSKTVIQLITLALICTCLTACFHLCTPADFPPSLRTLHLTTNGVHSTIKTAVMRQLHANHVHLVSAAKAPLILALSHSRSQVDMPIAFNNSAATSYRYQMSIRIKLIGPHQQVILEAPLTVSDTVIHNVNQVDTPVITPLMRRVLTRRLTNRILNRLTSTDTQKLIKITLNHNQ